ncbi:hypothetical protein P152DRAFT_396254 [Eremomyces bilateralis CBS 781.70]|uniref:Zn(2)-C6 fungal-type domain-containing protein n=1 Tax=Eremomyces bilateralis CBS 781.70 TaxID=1392243 RepID=A0A6G1G566_9PEZI|nr:uncharacterized protein P152DRAFT_396254 [Eremomyces bilateralis CBS 781.70]KAF1813081.1 hypothetical protein P152DRAFT_396254 [Eremomyces bilateralis CBS 781.70]
MASRVERDNSGLLVTTASRNALSSRPRRPCDACRKRKSRCELHEGEPECVLCQFHHQPCTFLEDPQPRKKRRVSKSPISENGVKSPNDPLSGHGQESRSIGSQPGPVSNAIRQQHLVEDYATLKGPSLLKQTLGLQNHRHSALVTASSVFDPKLLELGGFQSIEDIAIGSSVLRKVADRVGFLLTPDHGTRNCDQEVDDLDSIGTIVSPHGQALINIYFRIVHPSFPVLHKKVFLEKYSRTHREFSPPLLAAVCILALNWWTYSSELALLPKPDLPRLEEIALKAMGDVVHRPKLSMIQAGLLLLQRPNGESWLLVSNLVALGQELGLHLDCSHWQIPPWEKGLRKRLAWALYMQDKWGCLVHGRPSHITDEDWDVTELTEVDFPERAADEDNEEGSTEMEKGRVLFWKMIDLARILADILSSFYSLKADAELRRNLKIDWLLEHAKPIQLQLKAWFTTLPEDLKLANVAIRKLSSTGYLHLAYYATEIALHRRLIFYLSTEHDPALIQICRAAAHTRLVNALRFVNSLRPEHLQSFWYSASAYNFALIATFIGLLWATSETNEAAAIYREKLDEYRWDITAFKQERGNLRAGHQFGDDEYLRFGQGDSG